MPLSRKKRQLKKEQKMQEYRDSLAKETGILFSSELTSDEEGFPFLKYIVNALILFGATFGSLYCLISSFELELSVGPLFVTCVFAALMFSFMYVSFRTKIITYLFILVSVITVAFRFFVVVNSGISAIWNNILKFINNSVDLPFLREYTIYYDDEYTAMSIAICVLAVGLMLLQNINVSEKMSLRGLFLFSFPIVQFGMYFNFDASKFGMLCVVASWILVAGVRFTNGYNGLTHKLVAKSSVKKHRHSYGFVTDSKNVSSIATVWLWFILGVTALVFAVVPANDFEVDLPTNSVKTSTERVVKNFLSYGFSSMYSMDREASSPGQLSNTETVAFDGRTDLKVQTVNYYTDRIYLRKYVGYYYDNYSLQWKSFSEDNTDYSRLYNFTAKLLKYDYAHEQIVTQSKHKFTVQLVDTELAAQSLSVPYYSVLDENNYSFISSGEAKVSDYEDFAKVLETQTYEAYTLDSSQIDYTALLDEIGDEELKKEYESILSDIKEDAYKNALYVPENNIETLKKFCEKYNISQDDTVEDKITKVTTALEENFEYTLRPGKVPYGEDYVNYFLNANFKGYCQHFASAATLIFRYLGIPARYAEGYAIDREDFYTATSLRDENIDDWVTTVYRTDSEVMEVQVPDSSGHAWVEVYKDGIGWVTVEATTAPSEDSSQSLLSSLFGANSGINNTTQSLAEMVNKIDLSNTKDRLILLCIIVAVFLALLYFVRMGKTVVSRHLTFKTKNLSANLSSRYNHLYLVWQYSQNTEKIYISFYDFINLLRANNILTDENDDFCSALEKAIFSGEKPVEDTYKYLTNQIIKCKRQIVKNMKFSRKFSYYFTKFMW